MKILAAIMVLAMYATAYGSQAMQKPVEVGNVHWGRDFEAALNMSAESGKPVFVLFQEVPG